MKRLETLFKLEAVLEVVKSLKKEIDLLEAKIVDLEEAEEFELENLDYSDEYMDTEIAEHSQSWIVQYNYDNKCSKYNPELDNEDEIPF